MNILNRVEIDGLWDALNLSIDFHPNVNFLIGSNGSGKTTVINLISAVLNADFNTLDRLPFHSAELRLSQPQTNRKPIIEVIKTPSKQPPFFGINYRIRDKTTEKPMDYSLDSYEEQLSFREYSPRSFRQISHRPNIGILEHISRLVNFSWLSIHRSELRRRSREEAGYESTVDNKLNELSSDLIKYFSLLSRRGANLTANFQEKVFLSLIPAHDSEQIVSSVRQLNLEDEEKALIDIFHSFGFKDEAFADNMRRQFELLSVAREDLEAGKTTLKLEPFGAMIQATRIHSLVQEWNQLLQAQQELYNTREIFLNTINTMLLHKNITISDNNELAVIMDNGPTLTINQLSSGEKQLLIILGEALLQEKRLWIYIADEPELSLHVSWQEQLVDNLLCVNPNAQIIFATHSPDIVSHYDDCIFDMEKYT
ncbi:AAA family ATPase [Chloroflexota bacterium]